ncbi:MAG: hypothetical protein ACI9UO_000515 [Nitrospinales bacterium]|jgi:hypothetical protein
MGRVSKEAGIRYKIELSLSIMNALLIKDL